MSSEIPLVSQCFLPALGAPFGILGAVGDHGFVEIVSFILQKGGGGGLDPLSRPDIDLGSHQDT